MSLATEPRTATGRTKVLIVDDSAVVRQVLSAVISRAPGLDVVGSVSDPIFAMRQMNQDWPDVVVLDLEMPRMDGLTFLKKIMSIRPTPVVICSSMTSHGMSTAMGALAAGAVSVVAKPTAGVREFMTQGDNDLVAAVRAAAASRRRPRPVGVVHPVAAPSPRTGPGTVRQVTTRRAVVAIGTSTGGTQALETVLRELPADSPGAVVVQHMPERFTAAFADRLDGLCRVTVREAVDRDPVTRGVVLIAPGGRHMELQRTPDGYQVRVFDGPPVNRHRPSVDVLFRSVAVSAGRDALGIIMTGMGDDGARGLLDMRRAGAHTVAQDEASCVVYGMPGEAVRLGAVADETPLDSIAEVIRHHG